MRKLTRRDLRTLTLLSIIVPVSLLVSFRLTGILGGPEEPITILETITLENVKWESERPYSTVDINEIISSFHANNEMSVNMSTYVGKYVDEMSDYGGSDFIGLLVNVTAFITGGHIEDVRLVFRESFENSQIIFFEVPQLLKVENLSKANFKNWAKEVFINLTGINRPNSVYLWTPIHWVLRSPNNQTHQLEIFIEITYFNGTVYKKVVQPFQLVIGPDDNDSFDTADDIGLGSLKAYIDLDRDPTDYYRIWLEQGQVVQAKVFLPLHERVEDPQYPEWYYNLVLNMYLYDPSRELVAHSVHGENATRQITITVNFTGWWYIKIGAIWAGVEQAYELNLIELPEGGNS